MNYLFVALSSNENELGTGHFVRTRKLFDTFSEKNLNNSYFLSNVNQGIKLSNNKVFFEQNLTSKLLEKYLTNLEIDVMFVDALDEFFKVYSFAKRKGIIIYAMDIMKKDFLPDVIFSPSIYSNNSFKKGIPYTLINTDQDPIHYEKKNMNQIFVCFGGFDKSKHYKLIKKISKKFQNKDIKFVADSISNKEKIDSLGLRNVDTFFKPSNFYEMLNSSYLAIISGGVLLQETIYLGVPAWVKPQYIHQKNLAKHYFQNKLILGYELIKKNKLNLLKISNISNDEYKQTSILARSSSDGLGLKRVLDSIEVFKRLEWDSKFFGFEIGSIVSTRLTKNILNKLKNDKNFLESKLTYLLLDKKDITSINVAKKYGFYQVDERVTFSANLLELNLKNKINREFNFKLADNDDAQDLYDLSSSIEWNTRYYNDDRFPKSKLKIFYGDWIKKSIKGGYDSQVYLIREEKSHQLAGFISIRTDSPNDCSIGLIGVNPKFRGKSLGKTLIISSFNEMIRMGYSSFHVVTQNKNKVAKRLYLSMGMRLSNDQLWMHKWN